jgi:3-(3-hydroxy-phenyl)propionate hydroxylase
VRLLKQTRAVACRQSDSDVEITVQTEDGEREQLTCAYAIAADGARSTMRTLLAIPFEGFTYPERFLIISTPHNMQDEGYAYRNYLLDPIEWAALFKISWNGPPGLWRLVTPARPDESEETLSRQETARQRLARFFPALRDSEIPFYNWYTVDQRVAARFREGRVLLAGDAAHLNNPLGAMGLNSGLHDAINLGEGLVAVLTGQADGERLDRYCRQRRHVAVTHVQAASMADKRNMEHRDPQERQRYLDSLKASAENAEQAKSYMMKASLVDSLRDAATVA